MFISNGHEWYEMGGVAENDFDDYQILDSQLIELDGIMALFLIAYNEHFEEFHLIGSGGEGWMYLYGSEDEISI